MATTASVAPKGLQATELHHVGRVMDFRDKTVRLVSVGGREIGVFRFGTRFRAVRNVCPHKGAPVCLGRVGGAMLPSDPGELVYGLEGSVLRCPWHQWEFDLNTGRVLFREERRHLTLYPVVRRGQEVYVKLPRTRSDSEQKS